MLHNSCNMGTHGLPDIYTIPYDCEMIYSRVKLPTKAFTKNGSSILQIMEFKNVDYNVKGMICMP